MNNIFKTFHEEVSWNTKFYVLLAICTVLFTYALKDLEMGFFIGALISLLLVLGIDLYLILSKRYTKSWKYIKIVLILLILAMTLIGFTEP